MTAQTATAIIGLGANLGDRAQTLRLACDELRAAAGVTDVACSSMLETDPIGGPEQPNYLNAVARLRTTLTPPQLLALCLAIEANHGRQRTVRWGARTLDLDLINYRPDQGPDAICDLPGLTLPHPRAAERAFVLGPWAELEPDALLVTPSGVRAIAQLLVQVAS
jgi:dihydroneopterin aldolase / 2-amino-4-hydroxy-6-hydroxymethyldihydropteridine diphosphokinase